LGEVLCSSWLGSRITCNLYPWAQTDPTNDTTAPIIGSVSSMDFETKVEPLSNLLCTTTKDIGQPISFGCYNFGSDSGTSFKNDLGWFGLS
jgi:hypothetical protein